MVVKIAQPYAEALLTLANSNDSLKATMTDMGLVAKFLADSNDLKKFLANPLITQANKKCVLKDVLGKEIQPKTMTFVMLFKMP